MMLRKLCWAEQDAHYSAAQQPTCHDQLLESNRFLNSNQIKIKQSFLAAFFMMKKIALIYMGGTFGCVGEPLSPMPAEQFLPHVAQVLPLNLEIECFVAPVIKDSSALYSGRLVTAHSIYSKITTR